MNGELNIRKQGNEWKLMSQRAFIKIFLLRTWNQCGIESHQKNTCSITQIPWMPTLNQFLRNQTFPASALSCWDCLGENEHLFFFFLLFELLHLLHTRWHQRQPCNHLSSTSKSWRHPSSSHVLRDLWCHCYFIQLNSIWFLIL